MEQFFTNAPIGAKEFFGFDWQFALTDTKDFPSGETQWRQVQIPHDWSMDYPVEETAPSCGSGGYARTGIGWYRKSFGADFTKEQLVSLYFEGVYMNCDVWLNGTHVGGHVYGYTSFTMDITPYLTLGENWLMVRVDNSQQPGSRWYTGSGITRDVFLTRKESCHIATWGVCVTTPKITKELAQLAIRTQVAGAFGKTKVRLDTQVVDAAGAVCAQESSCLQEVDTQTARQTLTLQNPALWEIESPQLYTAVSALYVGETLVDVLHTPFGVRDIAYTPQQGFLLNGEKLILQGVCLHHDGGCVGAAVPPSIWARRLKKLKQMGVNALRFSHNPPDPVLLDMADQMGFVVMDEAFDEWQAMKGKEFGSNTHESRGYSEWFESCWQQDMTAMLLRDRNHPSIIMWSIGNEVPEQIIEGGWELAQKLAGLCHNLDPTRPITQACDQVKAEPFPAYNQFLQALDIVGVNYTDRWRERTETHYDEEKREHPDWLLLGTEDSSVGGRRGDYRLKTESSVWGRTCYYANMFKAEKLWKFIRTRPYVLGSFMWTGVDYLGECFWPDKSGSAGVIDLCGFEKDGYYFYQSVWTKKEPVLHAFPHLNLDLPVGTIYPLVVYTNCYSAELFVDGVSYGVKAYEFPARGMTKEWGHFAETPAPITTSDLHLSWDIPFTKGEILVVGMDSAGQEISRQCLRPAGEPASLQVKADQQSIVANGRNVLQLELALLDATGQVVPHMDLPITLQIEGGTLLGMDNGRTDCRALPTAGERQSYRGLAYAVVRAPRQAGTVTIIATAQGLAPVTLQVVAQ